MFSKPRLYASQESRPWKNCANRYERTKPKALLPTGATASLRTSSLRRAAGRGGAAFLAERRACAILTKRLGLLRTA